MYLYYNTYTGLMGNNFLAFPNMMLYFTLEKKGKVCSHIGKHATSRKDRGLWTNKTDTGTLAYKSI